MTKIIHGLGVLILNTVAVAGIILLIWGFQVDIPGMALSGAISTIVALTAQNLS